jgi:hypothetical protein
LRSELATSISSVSCDRVGGVLVLDEVAQLGPVLADRLLERDGVGHAERQLDLVDGDTRLLGDLLGPGLATQFGLEAGLGGPHRGEGVVEMDGIRTVRDLSAIARVMAWRIHQVA